MKSKTGKLTTSQGSNNLTLGLGVVLVALLLFLTYVSFIIIRDSNYDREYTGYASDLRVLSQEISKNATEAAAGKTEAFDLLKRSRDEFEEKWRFTLQGNAKTGLPASEIAAASGVQNTWSEVKNSADQILSNQETVLNLHGIAETLAETIPKLQVEYDDIVQILLENDAPADQVAVAQRQSLLAERIVRSVNNVLTGDEDAVVAADRFGRDAKLFGRVLNGMVEGNTVMGISKVVDEDAMFGLEEISSMFEFVDKNVDQILETSPELFKVRKAATNIFENSQTLKKQTSDLSSQIQNAGDQRTISPTLAYIVLGIIIVIIVIIGLTLYRESQARLDATTEQNEQNQNAILRLLDELADLADGDLTTEATVTEDFTGAIADSINFAIDQMRGLVKAIRDTAVQVAAAAQETQATAMHLADASEHQAQEIAGASAAVNEMAVSIDQVSSNAAESAAVAERSVAIAKKGAEVVQNTIRGMDTIREQIQETAKRIKRLGESSQEIGDIVSLINDIADQTNILSLNAAIQASMAGDAGRGFAVVADEVQRLAERSSAATKQIEALVKTIQTDTNEAVISMEHTTAEVVRGARLAQDAGVALEEIENVSMNLADLIQNISNAARQQSSSAGHISNTMNVIQEITSQTSAGTTATAKSIGNLAEMANQLRSSVAGFKLPEEGESGSVV
ncbi:MAG: type IV pili methyl-accepting chemotaxis transducer N-terminal domain-containing protein [Hahellaceae bacterium]|nr:type IV pili methyl-accepting chemotaxis transducer N-terminal domain-containing protein [Hahellaceae bacterium]MCP5169324.1 type IV pili methyl-accepting chemotaxis transducer N-terminal domain-containing protein [Hahellaceae bacterium]